MKHCKYPNIEAERARAGMTVQELADTIGFSRNLYSRWMHGDRMLTNGYANMLSEFFNVPIAYLTEGGQKNAQGESWQDT